VRGKPRPVQIAVPEAPQHHAKPISLGDSSGDAGGKPGGCGAIFLIRAAPDDFVQRAQGQPAVRQGLVERGDAKR
jgi:hypothetical protein